MRPPNVAIDEPRLCGVVDQVAQKQPTLRYRPVDDMGGVRGKVERSATGAWDGTHQRMDRPLQFILLIVAEIETEYVARVDDGMINAQPFNRRAGFFGECILGGAHVGELCIGTHRRHHPSRQH